MTLSEMPAVLVQEALAFLILAVLAGGVALRRDKSSLHWIFVALLVGLLLWTGGAMWSQSVRAESDLRAAYRLMFLGAFATPACWLLLAARFARLQTVETRADVVAALLTPALLSYLLLLTDPWHHWMIARLGPGNVDFGPAFWLATIWAYAYVLGGAALLLQRARRHAAPDERRKATLLALAALAPLSANLSYVAGFGPWSHDPTPLFLGLSAVLLFALVSRYQLLENLPLVRRDVIEHLREGVVVADPSGRIVDANPAAARLLAREIPELRGLLLARVVAERARSGDRARVEHFLERLPQDAEPQVAEIQTAEDQRLEISAAVVRSTGGHPAGRFLVLRDRTEERRFQGMVQQSQRLESVGLLAAGIAHEVNNPLAFVRANLVHLHRLAQLVEENAERLAKPDSEDPDEVAELQELPGVVEETLVGVERIAQIVASMRRLSRSDGQELAPIELNEVVRESVKLAGLQRSPGIEVATRLAEDLGAVRAARERLIQVFLNLLLNAKQALAERGSGSIVIETRRAGEGSVEVRVADDGPGMDEEVAQRIFEAFFTTKAPDEGTGLGLSIAFDIVRDHGGWLEVVTSPGEGACFTVRLPVAGA